MSRDPAFLFYSSDFLVGTYDMTDAQVGQYIRLLCLQHAKGHLSEALMTSAMGGVFDEAVAGKFLVDENRCYYNGRLDDEINRRNTYTDSRRKNLSTSPTHMQEHMPKPMLVHMEDRDRDIPIVPKTPDLPTKKEVVGDIEKRFNKLWALYPKKQGKGPAYKDYERAIKDGVTDETIEKGIKAYIAYIKRTVKDAQYIKHGSTWFHQRSWDDDFTEQGEGTNGLSRADKIRDDGRVGVFEVGGIRVERI